MSLTPPPHNQGYNSYLAAMQPWEEAHQLPALALLKSLDDLDEEDEDDEDEDEDDPDEDFDDDEDEDEEEEDEDGGVKPLKMTR